MTISKPLTDEELNTIETRARLATPPPWLVNPDPRKYVQMPFSAEEDVLRDRDANAAFCANARDDVPRLIAEIRRQRAELQPLRESDTYGWKPLMREIAKLSDALGLDDGDWEQADEDTLLEQFDPWTVIRSAIDRLKRRAMSIEERTNLIMNTWLQEANGLPLTLSLTKLGLAIAAELQIDQDEISRLRAIFDCDLDEMQAAFGQNILRHWDRDRITKFATWLLGEDQTTALNHLDRIIDTYQQTGLGPMLLAIRAAKEWRGVVTSISNSQKE